MLVIIEPPWYNYQPLCGIVVMPSQNPLIHPGTIILLLLILVIKTNHLCAKLQ